MLRIVRCTTRLDDAPDVEAHCARVGAGLRDREGNLGGLVGRRAEEDAVAYALVTAWNGFAAMQSAIGGDVLGAPLLDPVAGKVRGIVVEHFERMDLPASGTGGNPRVLRIYAGSIPHRQAESFYAFTRDSAWPEVGRAEGLVAAHVGRRIESDAHHVALVTAWRSWDDLLAAFPEAAASPLVLPADEGVVADLRIEHLDVVPPAPGR